MRHRDLALPAAAAGRERSSRFSTYRDGGLERFRRRVGVVVSDALIGRDRIIEYRECAELIAWHPNGGVSAKRGQAVSEADIVVAAVGRPELIKGDWIKPGAVVIDAGYNPGNIGGVEYTAAAQQARLITPVPGGVGPTTVALLLAQTVDAADRR
jgi:predicted amino acid dehydrogenase